MDERRWCHEQPAAIPPLPAADGLGRPRVEVAATRVAQVQLDGIPNTRLEVSSQGFQTRDSLRGQDDLEAHLARL